MKTPKRIERYFKRIEAINYNTENGGAYAYLQFLAYSREIMAALKHFPKTERYADAIEGINWMFNENLQMKFAPRHQLLFDDKRREMKDLWNAINLTLSEPVVKRKAFDGKLFHAQAA